VEAGRFDALVRLLTVAVSRRTALALTLGGALGLSLGPADAEAKRKKRSKKKKKCKNFSVCQTCRKGKCKSKPTGADCRAGHVCQDETCVCPPGEEDSGGVCGDPPTCAGNGEPCLPPGTNEDCCGGVCLSVSMEAAFCVISEDGEPCHTSADCANPIVCRGFVCVAP
jgi:hypothetical protein